MSTEIIHEAGHRLRQTKQVLREKYWFSTMNGMKELNTKQHREDLEANVQLFRERLSNKTVRDNAKMYYG